MVVAAQRAYSDAVRWIKSARPKWLQPWRLARRLFQICFVGGVILLGSIGLLNPRSFGSPTSRSARALEWWALAGLVALCALWCLSRQRSIGMGASRFAEPFRRRLDRFQAFDPAVHALRAAPAALQTRFAIGWVWGPAAIVVAAGFFAASSAYFIVDAVLARLQVGWQQPLLAVVNALISVGLLRLTATRLSTWRLAFSVHRELTAGYGS